MKHTPTWKVLKYGDGYVNIGPDDGHGKVATVHLRNITNNSVELQANAQLIAASPDLLDFARKATDYIKRHSEANQDIADFDLLDEGEAVILKATQ